MQVLVADDDRVTRRLVTRLVGSWGYETVEVAAGDAAWERLSAETPPSIAILDWMMPGMDGIEVCRRLAERQDGPGVYRILVTSKTGKRDLVRGLDSGAHDFLTKPVDPDELRSRVAVGRRLVEAEAKLREYADEAKQLAESLAARLEFEKRLVREREMLEAQVRRAQKHESLGLMAGGIAHDFNNLLHAILGGTQLVSRAVSDDDPNRKILDNIQRAATKAAELSGQMLTYSGHGKGVSAPLDLPGLVRFVVKQFEPSVLKHVTVEYELAEDLPACRGDGEQLRRALENLLVNAVEAIGEEPGRVTVSARAVDVEREELASTYVDDHLPAGRYVRLTVADTGRGMSADERERVFDPFFTTKFIGRGLGMAAVLGIVRGHGGAIEICTAPAQGTAVIVYLPLETRDAEPQVADGASGRERDGSGI